MLNELKEIECSNFFSNSKTMLDKRGREEEGRRRKLEDKKKWTKKKQILSKQMHFD